MGILAEELKKRNMTVSDLAKRSVVNRSNLIKSFQGSTMTIKHNGKVFATINRPNIY